MVRSRVVDRAVIQPADRSERQPALLDADAVPRRELGQVVERELHGAGDVEDRLVAVAEVIGGVLAVGNAAQRSLWRGSRRVPAA